MAKLIVESGGDRREVAVTDPCRIGRDADNDVPLDDGGASRRHARISKDGDAFVLEDLKSANGTFKNEARVDRARLAEGDVIRIGDTTLRFSLADIAGGAGKGPKANEVDEIRLDEPASGAPFVLIGVAGELKGKRIELKPPRTGVGRKATNAIVLNDAKVSGVHCEFTYEGGRPVLRDLGSTNGTYLEGKRIDEITLSHGDRVGFGESVAVVADASLEEPPLEREPSPGEQTIIEGPELRVVKARVRTASSLAGLLLLLLLLAGVGGAGWYWYQLQSKRAAEGSAPPASGNLLGDRWSFETTEEAPPPLLEWSMGDGGDAFALTLQGGRSGMQCLRASLSGKGAIASLRTPLPVSARRYSISAFARATGEATAILAVRFLRGADPTYRLETTVGTGGGAAFSEIRGEVVAPSDSDRMQLVLVGAGNSGEVAFDDLDVREVGIEAPAAKAVSAFEVESFGESRLLRRNDETLVRFLPVVARDPPPDGRQYDAGLFRDGTRLLASGGTEVNSTLEETTDAKSASLSWSWSFDAARIASLSLPIDLRGPLLDQDVAVLSGAGLEPFRDTFAVEGAKMLVVGKGPTRLRLAFEPSAAIEARREELRFALTVSLPAGGGKLKIATQVDFVDENVDAAKAAEEAQRTYESGALGETLAKAREIQERFPFHEVALAKAEELRQKVERDREALKKSVAAAVERAKYLKSDAIYRDAQALVYEAAGRLAGTPDADVLAAQAAEIATEREAIMLERQAVEAKLLLSRIQTALAQTPPRVLTAREIESWLRRRWPGSAEAQEAERLLAGETGASKGSGGSGGAGGAGR